MISLDKRTGSKGERVGGFAAFLLLLELARNIYKAC